MREKEMNAVNKVSRAFSFPLPLPLSGGELPPCCSLSGCIARLLKFAGHLESRHRLAFRTTSEKLIFQISFSRRQETDAICKRVSSKTAGTNAPGKIQRGEKSNDSRSCLLPFFRRSRLTRDAMSAVGGKYVIVTGGNAGLGLETTKALCRLGYYVTISARSEDKAQEAISSIKADNPDAKVDFIVMELKVMSTVRAFAEEYIRRGLPLHILVNNAGIMNTPFEMTSDGFEAQFQVNHLSHFLLTHLLLPLIKASGGGRVVVLASRAHMRYPRPLDLAAVKNETADTYNSWDAYGRSKLSNILFARSLAQRFPLDTSGIAFNALHPGLVDTKLLSTAESLRAHAISVEEGIKTTLHLCTSDEVAKISGRYFQDCALATDESVVTSFAQSDAEAEKLWVASLEMIGIREEEYGV